MEAAIALLALSAMEIVLGIDNIVFIAIITAKLPVEQQASARRLGLILALVMRILLLFAATWVMTLKDAFFELSSLGLFQDWLEAHEEVNGISGKDLILLFGGLFLIWKSVTEIHHKIEGDGEAHDVKETITFGRVIFQIMILDMVFSLDSVITAVGMVNQIWVMVTAVVIAIGIMLIFANPISDFVSRNPTLKMLALSFLILIGVMLVAEGVGTHINKGYIYFAMSFALLVELLNLRVAAKRRLAAELAKAKSVNSQQ